MMLSHRNDVQAPKWQNGSIGSGAIQVALAYDLHDLISDHALGTAWQCNVEHEKKWSM
jgi:hypothetical protein